MRENYRRGLEIVLWGPSGSGKTYLINALEREIQLMANDNQQERFILKDINGDRISGIPTFPIHATKSPIPHELILERIDYRAWETIVRHRIMIQDDSGDVLEKMVETGNVGDERFGIVLIDASLGIEKGKHVNSDASVMKEESVQSNINMIVQLLSALSKKPHKSYLAICLSKIDQVQLRWDDPMVLAEICFNSKCINMLLESALSTSKIEFKYFSTSSVGYCWDANNKEWPNYNPVSRSIHSIDAWRPWNVTAPFFWLFQKLETEYKDIKRYPKPFF